MMPKILPKASYRACIDESSKDSVTASRQRDTTMYKLKMIRKNCNLDVVEPAQPNATRETESFDSIRIREAKGANDLIGSFLAQTSFNKKHKYQACCRGDIA
ncbi:hypothetical protein V6N13_042631 [Hibiscus sabdariffa]